MSYNELNKGILTKINFNEEEAKQNWKYSWEYDEQDYLYNNNIIKLNNEYYKINNTELDCNDSFIEINKINDNKYEYITSFYNGGTCLYEMLEEAFEK